MCLSVPFVIDPSSSDFKQIAPAFTATSFYCEKHGASQRGLPLHALFADAGQSATDLNAIKHHIQGHFHDFTAQ
jgi:hypothetical protein